jgi:hypothetical protein
VTDFTDAFMDSHEGRYPFAAPPRHAASENMVDNLIEWYPAPPERGHRRPAVASDERLVDVVMVLALGFLVLGAIDLVRWRRRR